MILIELRVPQKRMKSSSLQYSLLLDAIEIACINAPLKGGEVLVDLGSPIFFIFDESRSHFAVERRPGEILGAVGVRACGLEGIAVIHLNVLKVLHICCKDDGHDVDRRGADHGLEGLEYFSPSVSLVINPIRNISRQRWRDFVQSNESSVKVFSYDEILKEAKIRIDDMFYSFE